MSVELPPLPDARKPDENGVGWFTANQMHAYATEALAAQSAELAECKEAYALLFAENAKLRAEVEKRKPLTDELLAALTRLVENEGLDAFLHLDKGIGTATNAGRRWLAARAAIAAAKEQA